ncbi:hypothetical protein [Pseudomonas aeruginosa]|uniref:hypothetical protein n=1 Tax=Pseudomonas aeruginosa TaxID=287 RepID=UPI0031FF0700
MAVSQHAKLWGVTVTYEELLRHDDVINPILDLGHSKPNELRQIKLDAAVASGGGHRHRTTRSANSPGLETMVKSAASRPTKPRMRSKRIAYLAATPRIVAREWIS